MKTTSEIIKNARQAAPVLAASDTGTRNKALLAMALHTGKEVGAEEFTLEVRAGNVPAISLYEKHGFTRVGLRKNYYDRPKEDAILMTKFF